MDLGPSVDASGVPTFMSNSTPIRLLIADDHPVTREGFALILGTQADMRVVAQASDGREAVDLYAAHRPDVAVLDVQMPVLGGADATEKIVSRFPEARVMLLTTYDGDEDIYRGMKAGARAYLLKETPSEEIFAAIRTVHEGRRYLSPSVGARLAERFEGDRLTDRQIDVLRLMCTGLANKQIADRLGIGEGTVKTHVNAIFEKLGVESRTEAVVVAQKRGWLRR